MEYRRLTLFAGHYGSGKTNLAVNYALFLRQQKLPAAIADLDIVNPYFRTKDSAEVLEKNGVQLISSPFANSSLDVAAMPAAVYGLVADRETYGVLDVGGDDRGALALGRYVPAIREENDYEMLLVINQARPLTRTVEDVLDVRAEIEAACGLPFTAIVNNTNLGRETTAELVLRGLDFARAAAEAAGLPIKMTAAPASLAPALASRVPNLFPLHLQELYYEIQTIRTEETHG